MIFSHNIGQNRCREMAIYRNDSTPNIKRFCGGFWNRARFIEKILYYIIRVGLNQNVLLNLTVPLVQKDTPTMGAIS